MGESLLLPLFSPGAPSPSGAAALEPLRARLRALVAARAAGRGSRKQVWELLRGAGLTPLSLTAFYARVRAAGLEAFVDELVDPPRAAAVRALVDQPPPPPPPRVAVSTLAKQFYCEMQVHLDTTHDVRVVSPAMAAGAAGHAALEAEAEPTTDEEIARRIAAGEAQGLAEMSLAATVDGVRLVGRADQVQLQGSAARVVLEFKFSSRREIFPAYAAQVEAYGALLGARGFDTSRLVHAVVVLPRGAGAPAGLAAELARTAERLAAVAPWPDPPAAPPDARGGPDLLGGLAPRFVETARFAMWVFPHEAVAAAGGLRWALGYWKGARPPTAAASPAKCRGCAHNAARLCAAALAPPDGRFQIRRRARGDDVVHWAFPRR
jgi:hypothetical protein